MTVYTVETIDNAWSYIKRPDGSRSGPYRYRWEAQEEADELNAKAATGEPADDTKR